MNYYHLPSPFTSVLVSVVYFGRESGYPDPFVPHRELYGHSRG
jgi:hypothetical protein